MPKYSFIIPVYNRPNEVEELLDSLSMQSIKEFDIIVVEDGSTSDCEAEVNQFRSSLSIGYYRIPNAGPGAARNYGAARTSSEWLIFLDSDTLIPSDYLKHVDDFLAKGDVSAFGGADREKADFLPIQKAISYSMTSMLTTGGIRGKKKSLEKFKPRSFNMGIKKSVFEQLGGFGEMRYGEDIDFSLRIEASNFQTAFIPDAFVFHKRRTTFAAFFRQIMHSGEARVLLTKLHPGSLKLVHLFPTLFTLALVVSLTLLGISPLLGFLASAIFVVYFVAIGVHAATLNKSLKVGILSIVAAFIQLSAYGIGFIKARFSSEP